MLKRALSTVFAAVLLLPLVINAQVTISLTPNKDAAIGHNDGFNTGNDNYGTAVHNSTFKITGNDPQGFNENRGLISFDLSGIPVGATITSAKLNLYAYTDGSGHMGTHNPFYLERVTAPWLENTVTWNNQPASTAANHVWQPASSSNTQDYLNIDVLNLVNDMVSNTNYGFKLIMANDSVGNGVMFCSSNYSNPLKHPKLEITYTVGCQTLAPQIDAAVGHNDGFNSGDDNYGTAAHNSTFKITGNDPQGFNENRGLIQFDLSGVPQNATLTSAKLSLYAYTDGTSGGHMGTHNPFYLTRVTAPWVDNTVTWNNQPASTTTNQVWQPASTSITQDYENIDVINLVNDMITNGNHGFMLKMANDSVGNGVMFCSSNYSNPLKHPKLELCWDFICNAAFTYQIDTTSNIVSFTSASGNANDHDWVINGNSYNVANPTYQASPGDTIIVVHTASMQVNSCSDVVSDTIIIPVQTPPNPLCATVTPQIDAAIGHNDGFNTGNDNYGTAAHNSTFKITGNDPQGFNENRGLIQFDLSVVPQYATVTNAKLNLYAYTDGTTGGHMGTNNPFYLARVTAPWAENTVTWNNQPANTTTNQVLLPASTSITQDYLNIDVATLVNDMISNGNHGFMLKMANDSVGNGVMFCSSDHSNPLKHPKLELCWDFICNAAFTYQIDTANALVNFTSASGTANDHSWVINGNSYSVANPSYQANPGDTIIIVHTASMPVNSCSDVVSDTIIIPAVTFNPSCITVEPMVDAAIGYNDGYNTGDGNYIGAPHISAFKLPGNDPNGYNGNRGLIKFDLTTIPAYTTITSAKISLYAFTTGSTGGHVGTENSFYLQRVTEPWAENTVTWNNQPASSTQNQVVAPASTSETQDYVNIDVTNLVTDMVANGNNGFKLRLENEVANNGVLFCSVDNSNPLKHPKLELCYDYICNAAFTFTIDTANATVNFVSVSGAANDHAWIINGTNSSDINPSFQAEVGDTIIVTHTTSIPFYNCGDSAADTIIIPSPSCNFAFSYEFVTEGVDDESITLTANSTSGTHNWIVNGVNVGDTLPTVTFASNYGDTLIIEHTITYTSSNCSQPAEVDTIIYPMPPFGIFHTHVTLDGDPVNSTVYLLKLDYDNNEIVLANTYYADNSGIAYIDDVAPGDYIIKAYYNSPYALPTYHLSSLFWGDAEIFTINGPGEYPDRDVQLISLLNLDGPGFIDGTVDWADTLRAAVDFSGASVYAKNANGDVLGFDITDENGYFVIDSIPVGEYTLFGDFVGYDGTPVSVTLTDANPVVNGAQVLLGPTTVGIVNTDVVKNVILFPNPANAATTLRIESIVNSKAVVTIVNSLGQTVLTENFNLQKGKNLRELNTSNLSNGLYFVTLNVDNKQRNTQKLIKY